MASGSGDEKSQAFEVRHGIRFTRWGKPFWDATSRGELLFQRCGQCGHKMFPARLYCTNCMSANLEWVKASGKGKIYSYSVAYEYPPARVQQFLSTPYILALMDLEEGSTDGDQHRGLQARGCEIGLDVEVKFTDIGEGVILPKFKLVS